VTHELNSKPPDYYKALYQIAVEVTSRTDTAGVLDSIVRSTAAAMGVKACSLMLLSPDRKHLLHTAAYGLSDSYIKKGPVDVGPILAEVLTGKPVAVYDVSTDRRVHYRAQAISEGIASMLSLPLVAGSEIIGVLRIYTDKPRRFTPDDIEFLTLVAGLGGIALRKARHHESKEKLYEERLEEKIAQLEQVKEELNKVEQAKNKLLGFLSVVAHDLKSPLAAIQSYFSVMLGGYSGELNEKHRHMIERSSARINGLLDLISDLLDISRIESGQILKEMETVPLPKLAHSIVEEAHRLAEQKGLALKVEIPPSLPPIYCSAPRIEQALTNLLSNAIKFTEKGGTICLKVLEVDGQIQCEISDTGIGIPKEDLPRIFEDFYRASNVDPTSGTGLGLAIVKRIIEAHGGRIWVASPCPETGCGTKFTFVLPIRRNP